MLTCSPSYRTLLVHLVGQHHDATLAGHIGHSLQVIAGQHAPRRILGRVQDDQPGAVADQGAELVGVEAEIPLLAQGQRHRRGTHEVDHRFVDGETRVGVDHLIAGLCQGQEGEEHDRLGARCDHHVFGPGVDAPALGDVAGDGLAQGGDAGGRRVVGVALAQGTHGSLDDVGRRVEIRLADFQVDDVSSLSFQGFGTRQYLEGGLCAKPAHPLCKLHRLTILS